MIGASEPGQTYAVQGQTANGAWFEICCVGERKAWVAATVVTAAGDIAGVQIAKNIPTAPPARTAADAQTKAAVVDGWVRASVKDCDTSYGYPSTWQRNAQDSYLDENSHGVILVVCAPSLQGNKMTSRSAALMLASALGAEDGWSGIAEHEFFTGQGVKFTFTLASFSMQLSNGQPAELMLTTVEVTPTVTIVLIATGVPRLNETLMANLIQLIYNMGAD